MDNLRSLELKNCAHDVPSVEHWVKILCRVSELETLTVDEINFLAYIPVLLALQTVIIDGFDDEQSICRKLTKLVLSAVMEPLNPDVTKECIITRAGLGAPLIIEPRLLSA